MTPSRLLACCSRVWDVVKSVLCYDAPEGQHIYDDEDEDGENNDTDQKSKDRLSFCWRALKESRSVYAVSTFTDSILRR